MLYKIKIIESGYCFVLFVSINMGEKQSNTKACYYW